LVRWLIFGRELNSGAIIAAGIPEHQAASKNHAQFTLLLCPLPGVFDAKARFPLFCDKNKSIGEVLSLCQGE